jgi:serine phosphatase RsbU (regulator of sigma subunit)
LAASEIIAQLYGAVTRFSNGTTQQDDLTAVLIKFQPQTDERAGT